MASTRTPGLNPAFGRATFALTMLGLSRLQRNRQTDPPNPSQLSATPPLSSEKGFEPMRYIVLGMLARYGDAEAAVVDLEHAGIVGEQVELITDIDQDVRTANTPDEPSTVPSRSHHSLIARLFGSGGPLENVDVRDESGEMPNYIGRQEFYANHVKAGGAVVVVRTSTEQAANQAATILEAHGSRTPGQKYRSVVRSID